MIYKFTSPLFVMLPRKTKNDKRVTINMNTYRNLNGFVNNQSKIIYSNIMFGQLHGLKIKTPIKVTMQLFKPTKGITDKDNAISITKKYFFDAMVKFGCIPDDNDDYIKDEHSLPTVYEKGDGRVEIVIEEI